MAGVPQDGSGAGVNLGIIITPMLDMAFQILAFFLMTYHPSALEGHIDGNLLLPPPPLANSHAPDPIPGGPADLDPEKHKDAVVVVIEAIRRGQAAGRREGEPARILLRTPASPDPEMIADTDSTVEAALHKLVATLARVRRNGAGVSLHIEADRDLKYRYFVQVYDTCQAAGFRSIGFGAPTPKPR